MSTVQSNRSLTAADSMIWQLPTTRSGNFRLHVGRRRVAGGKCHLSRVSSPESEKRCCHGEGPTGGLSTDKVTRPRDVVGKQVGKCLAPLEVTRGYVGRNQRQSDLVISASHKVTRAGMIFAHSPQQDTIQPHIGESPETVSTPAHFHFRIRPMSDAIKKLHRKEHNYDKLNNRKLALHFCTAALSNYLGKHSAFPMLRCVPGGWRAWADPGSSSARLAAHEKIPPHRRHGPAA